MRILLVSYAYGPRATPCGLVAWRMAQALADAGAELSVVYSAEYPAAPAHPGITLLPCPPGRRWLKRPWQALSRLVGRDCLHWEWCRRAAALGARQQADLIYACSSPLGSLVAGAATHRLTGWPLVLNFTDAFPAPPAWQPSRLLARSQRLTVGPLCAAASGMTFLCHQLRTYQARVVAQNLAARSEIIPNVMMPWTELGPRPPGPGPVFLYLGALYGNRRPATLLAAFRRCLAQLPEATLCIAGERACRAVAPFLAGAGLTERVRLLGQITDPVAAMRQADVLINLDAPDDEPIYLPSKLAEYLATDRVVLCITPPGSPSAELLALVPDAAVVVPHDEAAIADGLVAATQRHWQPAWWVQRQTALAPFTAPVLARRLLTFLQRCQTTRPAMAAAPAATT